MDLAVNLGFEVEELPNNCPSCGRVSYPCCGAPIGLPIEFWDCCGLQLFIGLIEDLIDCA